MPHASTSSLDLPYEDMPGNPLLAPIAEEAAVRIAALVLPAS